MIIINWKDDKDGNINTSRIAKFKAFNKFNKYIISKTKHICFSMCGPTNQADVYKGSTRFIKYKTEIINIFRLGGKVQVEEKYMVNDIFESIKMGLINYQQFISRTENMQLRQTIQQIRNDSESFQYELFKVAEVKGYYTSPSPASQLEIDKIKREISN